MKTAVSIPDHIFKEVEEFAKEHNYSRSEVFAIALREFMEKLKSKQLLKALNDTYSEAEISEEKQVRTKSKKYYATKILKEPF
jgi:metal-responsive CopG/Arc/MetJ family transcriptional regulator